MVTVALGRQSLRSRERLLLAAAASHTTPIHISNPTTLYPDAGIPGGVVTPVREEKLYRQFALGVEYPG